MIIWRISQFHLLELDLRFIFSNFAIFHSEENLKCQPANPTAHTQLLYPAGPPVGLAVITGVHRQISYQAASNWAENVVYWAGQCGLLAG